MTTGIDVNNVLDSVIRAVKIEIDIGDTFAPVRWAEYAMAAYQKCLCGDHSCGGCAASLELAGRLEPLFPTASDSQMQAAVDAARRHWAQEEARLLHEQSEVARKTRAWNEKRAAEKAAQ